MRLLYKLAFRIFCLILPNVASAGGLEIYDAHINESPPTVSIMAGYMTISNPTHEDIVISELSSPDFGQVEIHETRIENNVASMIKLEHLVIEAGETVRLTPGAMHLMFIEPVIPLRAGDQSSLTITFSDGTEMQQVLAITRSGTDHEHTHNH